MQRQENKLRKKLSVTDSVKAKELFTEDIQQRYTSLQSGLTQKTDKLKQFPLKEYVPGIDSVQTALSFIAKNTGTPSDKLEQVNKLQTQLKYLQQELQKANDIQAFVREHEAQLKEQLMNTALAKQLKGILLPAIIFYPQTSP